MAKKIRINIKSSMSKAGIKREIDQATKKLQKEFEKEIKKIFR